MTTHNTHTTTRRALYTTTTACARYKSAAYDLKQAGAGDVREYVSRSALDTPEQYCCCYHCYHYCLRA